jgi:integrase
MLHCWEEDEARQFVDAAKQAGPQQAAFYTVALDSGARKGELCGLQWEDVNWEAGAISVVRQVVKVEAGAVPVFGLPKNGRTRTISLAPQTMALLRKHKAAQAQHRLTLGTAYCDHGLAFTREWDQPLQVNNLGQREFKRLPDNAKVRRIKFHGLRHTCATLLLKKGKPIHVVADRLGHKDPTITMMIYAHALPSMQKEAAAIHGDSPPWIAAITG